MFDESTDQDRPFDEPAFDEPAFGETALDEPVRAGATTEPITGWSMPALVIGLAIVAIGVSGLLDDTGLAEHPYWIVPAAGLFAACAAVAARTVRRVITVGP